VIDEYIRYNARRFAGRTTLQIGAVAVTFGQLDTYVDRMCGRLAEAGVTCGSRVGILAGNSVEFIQVLLATLRMGAVLVPVNTRLAAPEVRGIIEDVRPALLVTDEAHRVEAGTAVRLRRLRADRPGAAQGARRPRRAASDARLVAPVRGRRGPHAGREDPAFRPDAQHVDGLARGRPSDRAGDAGRCGPGIGGWAVGVQHRGGQGPAEGSGRPHSDVGHVRRLPRRGPQGGGAASASSAVQEPPTTSASRSAGWTRRCCARTRSTQEWLDAHRAAHAVGLRSNITIMFGAVEHPIHWARHLLRTRALQQATGGFTEFVGLPFVHMAAPIYLKGAARRGPTWREVVLMHAIARIVHDGLIDNIQASWVKLGTAGAAQLMRAGVNDLGGTLMDENISRAAGAAHGQMLDETQLQALVEGIGRRLVRRTTLYQAAEGELMVKA
jgi:hypothetical protein